MNKTKRNVTIGALTGVLVGFVFGVAFGNPDTFKGSADTHNVEGSIVNISKFRNVSQNETTPAETAAESDTVSLSAVDEKGEQMQILIIK